MPTARLAPYGRHTGFTLVELLVVLGIVAVLAGVILTGVFAVRRQADTVQCVANLHQLGLAMAMYMEDYKALPIAHWNVTYEEMREEMRQRGSVLDRRDLRVILGDYVPGRSVFYCPGEVRAEGRREMVGLYRFNDRASGLRATQIRTPKSRAAILYDPLPGRRGWPHGKGNVLFLDGHVKAYSYVKMGLDLRDPNDGSGPFDWPPD